MNNMKNFIKNWAKRHKIAYENITEKECIFQHSKKHVFFNI